MVLRRIQQNSGHSVVADWRLPLCRVGVADVVALLVQELCDLSAAQGCHAEVLGKIRHRHVVDLANVWLLGRLDPKQEDHVVLAELVPLRAHVRQHPRQAPLHLRPHLRGHHVAHLGALGVHDLEAPQPNRHARLSRELRRALRSQLRPHARDGVLKVPADLIRGLQPEEVEVAEQVVVDGQELQVQFGQCQGVVSGVVLLWNKVGVPHQLLRRVEGHLLDLVLLQGWPLQAADQDLDEELLEPGLLLHLQLLLAFLLRSALWRRLLLLRLGLLGGLESGPHGHLHRRQGGVLRDVEVADLRAEDSEHVERQGAHVLHEGLPRVQRRDVCHGELAHRLRVWEILEADPLEQLQALVVQVRDLPSGQRLAGGVVDLEVLVVPRYAQQLVEQPGLRHLRHLRAFAADHEVLVGEERTEEAPGGQLIQQVDHQLHGALQESELVRPEHLRVAEAFQGRKELVQQLGHEVSLVPGKPCLRIGILLLHLLPKGRKLLVQGQQLVPVQLVQVEPRLQACQLQAALANEVLLEALKAVDEELQQEGLLSKARLSTLPQVQHALEVACELGLVHGNGIPRRHASISHLLVYEQRDRQQVRGARFPRLEKRPQIPL
mmetsp:Transcript_40485/g.108590  ORF Transcript_40485/g.108590 Transcript_40485/m.108590 type:complete len:607 (+) Transcript_40485:1057-2877(+)